MSLLWLLPHQLHPAYRESLAENDAIVFIESRAYFTRHPYHKQRLILLITAMRRLAHTLKEEGRDVRYIESDTFESALAPLACDSPLILHMPEDFAFQRDFDAMKKRLNRPWDIREERGFLLDAEEARMGYRSAKTPRHDHFYRAMRKHLNLLMDGDRPVGGKYSFDAQNRKKPPASFTHAAPPRFTPDTLTREVIAHVDAHYPDHPGTTNFHWPTSRESALACLEAFLTDRLEHFGPYQDAMRDHDPVLCHSLLSPLLNCGLLHPSDILEKMAALNVYARLPLQSVEGFLRQLIGWREFVRAVYLGEGESYETLNHFGHTRELPAFFWDADTPMHCLRRVLEELLSSGYNHHIQRLMILCNYANLTGVDPQALLAWFNALYVDAHSWVMAPNVLGMGLYADGGRMSTKPYVASSAYIRKMSDYCRACPFDPTLRTGENACPFNSLYWHFLDSHRDALQANPRLRMPYHTYARFSESEKNAIRTTAEHHIENESP